MTHQVPKFEIVKRFNDAVWSPIAEQQARTGTQSYMVNHRSAWTAPRLGFESAIVYGIKSLQNLAVAHESAYESKIAEDGFLGIGFAAMARGLRDQLNGNIGRLDGGFCDAAILNIWHEAGFTEEL